MPGSSPATARWSRGRSASDILPGITRSVVIDLIKAQGLAFEERAFTVEEAYAAREAFVTSASQIVQPVVSIDGRPVGNGAPGLIASALAPRLSPPRRIQLNLRHRRTVRPPELARLRIASRNCET